MHSPYHSDVTIDRVKHRPPLLAVASSDEPWHAMMEVVSSMQAELPSIMLVDNWISCPGQCSKAVHRQLHGASLRSAISTVSLGSALGHAPGAYFYNGSVAKPGERV